MGDLRVEGFNFTPIENYNKFLNSNTSFGTNATSDFEKILFEKRLALETPGKTLQGSVEMLDFDKVIEDTYRQKREKTGLVNELSGSLKSQFKKADKNNAKFTLILGDNELEKGEINIKNNETDEQETIRIIDVYEYIITKINALGCNKK